MHMYKYKYIYDYALYALWFTVILWHRFDIHDAMQPNIQQVHAFSIHNSTELYFIFNV